MSRKFCILAVVLLCALTAGIQAQTYQGKQLVTASLLSSSSAIVPGEPFTVGLYLQMAQGGHTYWENPGDAGIATSIEWKLPEGFSAGPIQWPIPKAAMLPGDILDYAYEGSVLLMVTITPPNTLTPGSNVTLEANAKWLVCEDICVPGKEDLTLTLPVAAKADEANAELFAQFRQQLPRTDNPFNVQWKQDVSGYTIQLSNLGSGKNPQFFPLPVKEAVFQHPAVTSNGASATVTLLGTGKLNGGVLVLDEGATRVGFTIQPPASNPQTVSYMSHVGIWKALFYGFIGGLILNLMPCVLPVISLKIFGFVKQAGDDPRKILRHGLAFVAGIFVWFLGLGLVICALRSAGHQVTWAFQFQNPYFNLVIGVIVFVFALNLFGVFEIILPGFADEKAVNLANRGGYAGSFFQGVFATLLATPCTAPFLGTALGFAFSQTNIVILAMFGSVAAGMAFPYFFLSAKPGWMKFLPKPGMWMERVKQFMGFPLIATLLWLLYIIGQQRGISALIWAACFMLILGIACWIYGAFATPVNSPRSRIIATLVIIGLVAFGTWYCIFKQFAQSVPQRDAQKQGDIAWVPFSKPALTQLLSEGKPVFLDFTADWCVTCKFNERFAIDTPAVRQAIEKMGITPMQADWTNADPEITAELKQFGRVGVPFYVFYPAGQTDNPVVLPELITEQIVLDALNQNTRKK